MVYTPTYTTNDISPAIIDVIVGIFAALSSNISLIMTLVVLGLVAYLARDVIFAVLHGLVGAITGKR